MELLELGREFGCPTQHNTMHAELWSPSLAGKKNLKKKKQGYCSVLPKHGKLKILMPQSYPKISGRGSCFLSPGRKMVFSCQLCTDLIHCLMDGYTPVLM